jgi:hypothetical protein
MMSAGAMGTELVIVNGGDGLGRGWVSVLEDPLDILYGICIFS